MIELLISVYAFINIMFVAVIFVTSDTDKDKYKKHTLELKNGINFKNLFLSLLFPTYFLYLIITYVVFLCAWLWDKPIVKVNKK